MKLIKTLLIIFFNTALLASHSTAQEIHDDEHSLEEIIVTSIKVTAGGAQDINYARSQVLNGRIPHPNSLTSEGLMSQHDLSLKSSKRCRQLFCVFTEANEVSLLAKPEVEYLVGLGFATNIKAKRWKRKPLNIVAVVDKSGSMSGEPLDLVRTSLSALVNKLKKGDQFSVVLYGRNSNVFIKPTQITKANKQFLRKQIETIKSEGSTNMEEGLRIGFDLAMREQQSFEGTSRLILFTDERPNVGNTSAESFIGMATAGSESKIGMTTIGVGVQFDAELATKISNTRGGNLFFVGDQESAETIFSKELDYMVSELAYDVTFSIKPTSGFSVASVYGVPAEMLSWVEEGKELEIRIPTLFLSSRGGGVFVALAPSLERDGLPIPSVESGESLLEVELSYVAARDGVFGESRHDARLTKKKASFSMSMASLLIDQYTSMKLATAEHYIRNDQTSAYRAMLALSSKVAGIKGRKTRIRFADEVSLIRKLTDRFAFLSGNEAEIPESRRSKLWGTWKVISAEGDWSLVSDSETVIMTIDASNKLSVRSDDEDSDIGELDEQYFTQTNDALYFEFDELELSYVFDGERLVLTDSSDGEVYGTIVLERVKRD